MRTPRFEIPANEEFECGPWRLAYNANDGGRLTRIAYKDRDLLTRPPSAFRPPDKKHGRFEDRPVYGYDDCFPSVVPCYYPGSRISIPDHGEICWLPWRVTREKSAISFHVRSHLLPFTLKRGMTFTDSSIVWDFEVANEGKEALPFQHSMHPLLSADDIAEIELPGFKSVFDWNRNSEMESMTRAKVRDLLLKSPKGAVEMLFVRGIDSGELSWTYSNGLSVRMKFPADYFPTIGIWWDRGGYPDEDGIARNECAFEPTAGSTSLLTQAHTDGECLVTGPGRKFRWQIIWEVSLP